MAIWTRAREAPPVTLPNVLADLRDPRAATTVSRWMPVGQPAQLDWDAEAAIDEAYYVNVYVWAAVQRIANAIAGSPFRAGKDPNKPGDFDTKAPLAQLLGPPPGGPNPSLSPRRLWMWTVAQRLVTGRWTWEIETGRPRNGELVLPARSRTLSGPQVAGLWPLPATQLLPVPSQGGRSYWDHFVWGRHLGDPNREIRFKPDEVVFDWAPSQHDIRQPESPLRTARYDISVMVMQDRYDYAFLRNDARPSAVIVHAQFAEKRERDAFRSQFLSEYRGVDNAGKPVFIEATDGDEDVAKTFHVERLGLSQKDAEFIPRYEAKIRAVCVALGTPLSILGDASGRTFDNAGQEYANWWEGTILPLMQELQDAVNMQLAPKLGTEVGWFDTSHVKALQKKSTLLDIAATLPSFVEKGIILEDEVRDAFGLRPLDEVREELGLGPASVPETPTRQLVRPNPMLEMQQQGMLPGQEDQPIEPPKTTGPKKKALAADEGANTNDKVSPRQVSLVDYVVADKVKVERRNGMLTLVGDGHDGFAGSDAD